MKNIIISFLFSFLCFTLVTQGNSIYCKNNIELDSIVYQNVRNFILVNKKEGENNMRYIVFVLNIVKIDTLQNSCEFSVSFIRNFTEINNVNPIGFLNIENEIVLIRCKKDIEIIKNVLNVHNIDNKIFIEIKNKLCDDTIRFGGMTYRADYLIVKYIKGIIETINAPDEFSIDKSFWIEDFNYDSKDYEIIKISADSIEDKFP